jgi:hypothetical protein
MAKFAIAYRICGETNIDMKIVEGETEFSTLKHELLNEIFPEDVEVAAAVESLLTVEQLIEVALNCDVDINIISTDHVDV